MGRNYCMSKAAGVTVTTDRGVDITEVMKKRLSIGSKTLENSVCCDLARDWRGRGRNEVLEVMLNGKSLSCWNPQSTGKF